MQHLWITLDFSRAISVWEVDDPLTMAAIVAGFLPYAATEVLPVGTTEPMIAAMAEGGLVSLG